MDPITIAIAPEKHQTRMLMMCGQAELMKAVLGPVSASHSRAAATLLEGLALWQQKMLSVVLFADAEVDSCELALCDGLGFGQKTLHYDVSIAMRSHRNARRLSGLGDFRELRQLCLEGASR